MIIQIKALERKDQQGIDLRLIEEIFAEIDRDMDGRISIQEFVEAYFSQTVQVEDRIEELGKLITEDSKKREEIIKKLQEIQASE